MSEENNTELLAGIRTAHLQDQLPELVGKALGKSAVLIVSIDTSGGVLIVGNHNPDLTTRDRDHSMLQQMSELLAQNMKAMMRKAGANNKPTE